MVSEEPREDRCAEPVDGGYCEGWQMDNGSCQAHGGQNYNGSPPEGNQNAMETGIHSDPVDLFNWLVENEPDALEYIFFKLDEYAKQATQEVFEADVRGAETFEEAKTRLTGHGDDLLRMCVQDYARWRGTARQVKEGLITQQTRSGEHGPYKVKDSNPVNLDLDRLERTGLKQKNKYDLLPSPDQLGGGR